MCAVVKLPLESVQSVLASPYLCNLSALVVASQQRHVRRPSCFEQHEKRKHLQAVVPSVYKVSHEDVVG